MRKLAMKCHHFLFKFNFTIRILKKMDPVNQVQILYKAVCISHFHANTFGKNIHLTILPTVMG